MAHPIRAIRPIRITLVGRIVLALLLALAVVPTTGSYQSPPIEPLPHEVFTVIGAPQPTATTVPSSTPLTDFSGRDVSRATQPPLPSLRPFYEVKGSSIISGRHSISGQASWYCKVGVSPCHYRYPDGPGLDRYAAAGPGLREAMCGDQTSDCWRGRTVTVNGESIRLVDWCQCRRGEAGEKLIDLYWDAWVLTAAKGGVTIRW